MSRTTSRPSSRRKKQTDLQNISSYVISDSENEVSPRELDIDTGSSITSSRPSSSISFRGSPFTPVQNLVDCMRQKLEQRLEKENEPNVEEKQDPVASVVSPGLARLRQTPGRKLREKQDLLLKKHRDAKSRTEDLSVGGGVCIWPEMEHMRLTAQEVLTLTFMCLVLIVVTYSSFKYIHGDLMASLIYFYREVSRVNEKHRLVLHQGNASFSQSVLDWHSSFGDTMDAIHLRFDLKLSDMPFYWYICSLSYLMGLGVLMYFLIDSMFSKGKLTPKRIKVWITSLVVVGVLTVMMMALLSQAQRLENEVEVTVHRFSGMLRDLVFHDLDLQMYHNVLTYWRTLCLPPTTHGTLNILGLVAVRDVSYYLQYYSLPIITALLAPVVKLIIALKNIYAVKVHA